MKLIFIAFLAFCTFFSCQKKAKEESLPAKKEVVKTELNAKIALKFINEYCQFCNLQIKKTTKITTKVWIEKNKLVTPNFKNTYKTIVETAEKEDPELGLGFDPIFDAQDFPEDGFDFLSIENNTFVTVKAKGKEWDNFLLKIKVINIEGKWLIDAAGIINIAENKRAKR